MSNLRKFSKIIAIFLFVAAFSVPQHDSFIKDIFSFGQPSVAVAADPIPYILTISSHENISVSTSNSSGATVSFSKPTAVITWSGIVLDYPFVSCSKSSGSLFPVGNTVVTCSAYNYYTGQTAYSSFTVSVTLTVPTPLPTVTLFDFSPSTISSGQSSSITYSSTNANYCDGSGLISGRLSGISGTLATGPIHAAGTYSQTITCTGNGGSRTSVSRTLTVITPATPPTASISTSPANISYGASSGIFWASSGSPTSCTALGAWSNGGTFSGSGSTGALTASQTYSFYCTNAGGNSATVSAVVNVCPSIAPIWNGSSCVPPDLTPPVITLNGANPMTIVVGSPYVELGATTVDAVDGTSTAVISGVVNNLVAGNYTVTYSKTDAAGNVATPVTRTVHVVAVADSIPPVITLNGTTPITIVASSTYVYVDAGAIATDNVDGVFAATASGVVDASITGTYVITYSATDSSGNVATPVVRTINVIASPDLTPPVITLNGANPMTIVVGSPYVELGATTVDAVDGTSTAVISGVVNNLVAGNYTVTYSKTDAAGNVATPVTRTVHVVAVADSIPPVITLNGTTPITIVASSTYVYVDAGAIATDNVDGVFAATASGVVDASITGTYVITYSATDSSGNVATPVVRTINVIASPDVTPPVITLNGANPMTIVVGSPYVELGATTVDAVDGTSTAVISGVVNNLVAGNYTVTYSKTDAAGNVATPVTRTVHVVAVADSIPPVITLNGTTPITIVASSTYVYVDAGAIATDNVDGVFAATASGVVDASITGTYVITYSATDSSGNVATPVVRTINVIASPDVTPPVITLNGANPMTIVVGSPYVELGATTVDAVDGTSTAVISGVVNNLVAGNYTVTYSKTDAAGNVATPVTRTVHVVAVADSIPPVITLNGTTPITIVASSTYVYVDAGAIATDNVDGVFAATASGVVDASITGTYVITYSATDSSGNVATPVVRTINVIASPDVTPPVITLNGANPMTIVVGSPYVELGATTVDAVDGTSTAVISGVVNNLVAGNYTVTYSKTDAAGNVATPVTRTVHVVAVADSIPPVITILGNNPATTTIGLPYTDAGATAFDNVDGTTTVVTTGTVNTAATGTYILTYTATDASLNVATATRTVTVVPVLDIIPPVITLLGSTPVTVVVGSSTYSDAGATALDNIDGNITGSIAVTGFADVNATGTYLVTYNVSDAAGNAAVPVTRTVNVVDVADSIPPVITILGNNPATTTIGLPYTDAGATAFDNVDGTTTVVTTGTVNTAATGTYILTYTATDASLNVATATRTVTVVPVLDIIPPVITLLGSTPVTVVVGSSTYSDAGATALDNIDGNITGSIAVTGFADVNATGTYLVTYNVSDAAGNAAVPVTRTVNVVDVADSIPPVITILGNNPATTTIGLPYTDAGATAFDNVDGTTTVVTTGTVNTAATGTYILTYTATDASLNVATATRTVTVVPVLDIIPPVITLLGSTPVTVVVGSSTYSDAGATALDNIDGNITGSIAVTGFADVNATGTYLVTYNVSDAAGNAAVPVTRTVNVVDVADSIPPVITILGNNPATTTIGLPYTDAGATAFDNVDGTTTVVTTGTVNTAATGTYILTYTATDASLNVATATRTVTVVPVLDIIPPVITLLGSTPVTVVVGSSTYSDAGATALDNIDGNITGSIAVTGFADVNATGTYLVTYNVSDAAGNAAVPVTRTVNVVDVADSIPPVITILGNNPATTTIGLPYTDAGATAFDNVDGTTTVVTTGTVNTAATGTYILTYTATDASLNVATATRTVTVVPVLDIIPPVITLLGSTPVTVVVGSSTYSDAGATALDNIDGNITGSIAVTGFADVNATGTYLVTYNVSDAAGNAAVPVTRTVNVVDVADSIPPVITILGNNPATTTIGLPYTDAGATAFDNVDGTTTVVTTGTVNTAATGTYILTYTATDASLNVATATRTVTVVPVLDIIPPVITLLGSTPVTVVVGSSTYSDAGATALDNIDGNITGSIAVTGFADVNATGTYLVTYNVSDAAGNAAVPVTRTVNVVDVADSIPPVITILGNNPATTTIGLPYTDAGATAFDNVDGTTTVVTTGTVNTAATGTYILTYTATDASLNVATATRTVTVVPVLDIIPPVITLLGSTPVTVVVGSSTYSDAGATALDNIDGNITGSIAVTGFADVNATGTYLVTYNVSDAAGNAAVPVTRTVNVVDVADSIPPVITILGNNPATTTIGLPYTDAGATAFDNVDGTTTVVTTGTVNTAATGTYILTYTATDASLNVATATRTVTVVPVLDIIPPVITLLGSTPVTVVVGSSTYSDAGATALDNIDGNITGSIAVTGFADVNATGTYLVTYNVSDAAGNAAVPVTRTVNVVDVADSIPPVITILGNNPATTTIGLPYTDAGATAFDNVDGTTTVVTTGTVNTAATGTYILTYTATDASLNVATATRTVTVVPVLDIIPPVITLLGSTPVTVVVGSSTYSDAGATALDNIDGNITGSIAVTGFADVNATGTYLVTYNVSDAAGNAAVPVTRTVNVVDVADSIPPVITILGNNPATTTIGLPYTDAGATAFDNVDGTTTVVTTGTVNTAATGTYILTYTATDASLNVATATRTVTVVPVLDIIPPVITLLGSTPVTVVVGSSTYSDAGATALDNIDGNITGSIAVTGFADVNATGTYLVTYNVSDAAGNAAVPVTRTVNVVDVADSIPPVITILGNNPATTTIGLPYTDAGATAFDNVDGTTTVVTTGTVNTAATGTYILTYTATDASLNVATATRTVTVVPVLDIIPPVITLLGSTPVTVVVGSSTYSDAGATALDNIDGNITGSIAVTGFADVNATGTYLVTYNVSDAAGNAAVPVTRTVNVVDVADSIPPVITILGNNPATTTIGLPYTDAGATAFDNVDGTTTVVTTGTVNTAATGTYILTYTATDASLNVATATRTVTVVPVLDIIPPVITLLGSTPVTVVVGSSTYSDAGATALDNIDGNITGSIAVTGFADVNATGTYLVTYNVSDAAGNAAVPVTRTVNVVDVADSIPPVITILGNNPATTTIGLPYTDAGATAFDNVDGTTTVVTTGTVNTAATGTYILTYTATDASLNVATATRTVTVVNSFTITSNVTGAGSIAPSGIITVAQGDNQTISITPNVGSSLISLVVDGIVATATTSYTFTNVQGNHTVDATFAPTGVITFPITSTTGPNGTITPLGIIDVVSGGSQTYTITPNAGYIIENITVDGSSTPISGTYIFNPVLTSHTIDITFSAAPITILNSTINGTYYASYFPSISAASLLGINGTSTLINSTTTAPINLTNVYLTDVTVSSTTLTGINATSSTFINSELTNCSVINSYVKNYAASNCNISSSIIDPHAGLNDLTGTVVTSSAIYYSDVTYSNVTDTYIATSTINNSTLADSTSTNSTIGTSTITESTIDTSNVNASTISTSTVTASDIATSTVDNSTVISSDVASSTVSNSVIDTSSVIVSTSTDSIIVNSTTTDTTLQNSDIATSTIANSDIASSTITLSTVATSTVASSTIDTSVLTNSTSTDSTITNSTSTDSTTNNSSVASSTLSNSDITSSVVIVSDIINSDLISTTITLSYIANSTTTNSNIATSTVTDSDIASSTITLSTVATSTVASSTIDTSVLTNSTSTDSTIINSTSTDSTTTYSTVATSTVTDSDIASSTITLSTVATSTVASSTIDTSVLTNSTSTDSTITNSTTTDSTVSRSSIDTSTLTSSTIFNATTTNTSIANSTIQNASIVNGTILNDIITSGIITANGTTTVIATSTPLANLINFSPIANFVAAVSGLTAVFTDTSSDRNSGSTLSDTWTYLWNFGDGTTATTSTGTLGNNPTHTYSLSGLYSVVLTLIDSALNTSTKTSNVTVTAPVVGGGGGGSSSSGGYFVTAPIATTTLLATTTAPTGGLSVGSTTPPNKYVFTRQLKIGSRGDDVRALQQILKYYGYYTFDTITGYYGPFTKDAVIKFQRANNLFPYPGEVGPRTRAILNGTYTNTITTIQENSTTTPTITPQTTTKPTPQKETTTTPKMFITVTPQEQETPTKKHFWDNMITFIKGYVTK